MAFLDANVLYPARLRDLLIRLDIAGLYRARWSADVLDECFNNLIKNRPDLTAVQLERTRALMNRALPEALVEDYEPAIQDLELPDPNDEHVLAAAITAEASLIVTHNLDDFPSDRLPAGLRVMAPDSFIQTLLTDDPDSIVDVIRAQAAGLNNPAMTPDQLLDGLEEAGLTGSVSILRTVMT